MKFFLTLWLLLISANSFGQDSLNVVRLRKPLPESKYKLDSTYINYYVLKNRDTFYFPNYSTVFQCNYLTSLEKEHNSCRIFIGNRPGNGNIKINLVSKDGMRIDVFDGTINNGYYETGNVLGFSNLNIPLYTGQYLKNWQFGYWTSYYPNGKIHLIRKYIIEFPEPVKEWEYDENGKLIGFYDDEEELINLMNK